MFIRTKMINIIYSIYQLQLYLYKSSIKKYLISNTFQKRNATCIASNKIT